MNIKQKKYLTNWLFAGIFLISIIIIVGGITRLTDSGLSMVDWSPSGSIPPLNENEWQIEFDKYKEFPEYQKINQGMLLSEFKRIFFWEYLHRMLGRLLGLVFIIPFMIFLFRGWLPKKQKKQFFILLFLGGLQAFFGWYMVKSGLVNRPDVSHFRLAVHLITAFGIISYIYWLILEINNVKKNYNSKINKLSMIFLMLLIIQIIFGAFVAGLKAGYEVNPNNTFFETIFNYNKTSEINFINNGYDLQTFHRLFAWIVFFAACFMLSITKKTKFNNTVKKIFVLIVLQVFLGIITLIFSMPISIALAHQFIAMLLLLLVIRLIYLSSGKSQSYA